MRPSDNYVVPRETLDYRTSYDLIEETFYNYINQTKGPSGKKNLEIEAKIGYIMEGENQAFSDFKTILQSLSHRDFLIVGLMSPYKRLEEYFLCEDVISPHYRFFKETMTKTTFQEIKDYLLDETQKFPNKFVDIPDDLTQDFLLKDGDRVTYRFADKSWKRIKKMDRTNIDILHRGFPIRLSFSFEDEKDFTEDDLDLQNIDQIRIKNRKCYLFQYMEYSFTEVVQLKIDSFESMKIISNFLNSKNRKDDTLNLFFQNKVQMKETYEVELEIKDLKPFQDHIIIKPTGEVELAKFFGDYLKRFLKNAEALLLIPKFSQRKISDYCGSTKRVAPVIGQYMNEVYKANMDAKQPDGKQNHH